MKTATAKVLSNRTFVSAQPFDAFTFFLFRNMNLEVKHFAIIFRRHKPRFLLEKRKSIRMRMFLYCKAGSDSRECS